MNSRILSCDERCLLSINCKAVSQFSPHESYSIRAGLEPTPDPDERSDPSIPVFAGMARLQRKYRGLPAIAAQPLNHAEALDTHAWLSACITQGR